jgi:uncharacterized protein
MSDSADPDALQVVNNESESRFETELNGHRGILTYRLLGNTILLEHTQVPPEIEGRGVGSRLAQAALEFARLKRLRVAPICPFVADYLHKHPQFNDLLSSSTLKRLSQEHPPAKS